jgi:hypothetical protein
MDIQLTAAQRLQQELLNGFITDLEKQIQSSTPAAAVNADLGSMLNGLFSTFDRNKDVKFNANELTGLTGHLRQINSDQNIAQLFTTDGQLNFATASKIDITGDGVFRGTEDLVALQQIINSRTPVSQATLGTSTLSNNGQVKSGTGNVPGGLNNFNSRGAYFVTEAGFTILTDVNVGGSTTRIYDKTGKKISDINGDPHVKDDSATNAWADWHFGNDSTFILQDGTEIMFNTEGNANNNVYVTTGLYIKSGDSVYQTGQSFGTSQTGVASNGANNTGISKLEISATEFDAQYADAADKKNGAGVFAYSAQANSGRGGWAVMTDGGVFQDIKYEDWGVYLQAGKASFDGQYDGQVSVSKAQMIAALDGDAVRSFKSLSNSPAGSQIVPGSNPPIKADDLFLNYYFKEGADTKELKAFSDMISNGSSAEKLSVLDDYIRNGAEIPLTEAQESKFLNYLITPATSGIAKTYLELIENQADPQKFELLDKLARGEYTLNTSQQDVFFDFLLDFQNAKLAETYAGIIQKGADQASIQYLEDYAAGKFQVTLNTDQENKMLDYLGGSKNSNIAKSYVNFVKNGATEKDYSTLDEIFKKSGSINQVVAPSDLKFTTNLESIKNEFRVNIDPKLLLKYLEKADISALNSITGNMITNLTKSNNLEKTKTDTMNLLEDLTRVLMDPLTERLSTYKTEAASISKQILELQLKTLNTLDPNDPAVIKVKQSVNEQIKSLPDYLTDSDSATDGQSAAVKEGYAIFKKAFPAGKPPTAAQTAAALELINGNYILGDSLAFIANYAKFVSSGDTKSADKLMEIAKYFGANETYGSSLRQFSNAKLDAKSVEVASEILDFTKNLSAQNISDLRGPILVANRFMLDSVLNNKGGFNSPTEGDLTKAFFESLEEASKEKSSTVTNKELSEFLVSSIYSFSRDLYQDGKVQLISTTSLVQRDVLNKQLGPLAKDGIAQMQIDVFEGMLSFYQSQIQGENAKPEPDASKISQWQAQINSHQAAITALQRTLS